MNTIKRTIAEQIVKHVWKEKKSFSKLFNILKEDFPRLSQTTFSEVLNGLVTSKLIEKQEHTPQQNSQGTITSNTLYFRKKQNLPSTEVLRVMVITFAEDKNAPSELKAELAYFLIKHTLNHLGFYIFVKYMGENSVNKSYKDMINISIQTGEKIIKEVVNSSIKNSYSIELLHHVHNLVYDQEKETDEVTEKFFDIFSKDNELLSKIISQNFTITSPSKVSQQDSSDSVKI